MNDADRDSLGTDDKWVVRNRTGKTVRVTVDRSTLVVPALTEVRLPGADVDRYLLRDPLFSDVLEVGRSPSQPPRDSGALVRVLAVAVATFLVIGFNSVDGRSALFGIVYWSLSTSGLVLGGWATYLFYRRRGLGEAARVISQFGTLLCILAIGAGIPIATAFHFGGGDELLRQEPSYALLARLEVTALAVVASVMPALLYFVFDRQALTTLRRKFEQQIFRFDPSVQTIEEVEAKYGAQLNETYGVPSPAGSARLSPGTRLPLLIATLVISLGWMFTLQPGMTRGAVSDSRDLVDVLKPQPSTLVFGFLGAYYFATNLVVRRYMRGDLKPKAYTMIASRVLVVVILAWLLDQVAQQTQPVTFAIAFMAGVIPETAFTYVREIARDRLLQYRIVETQPLTLLEGVDLYERSSFEDEGVMNLQGLLHHDVIDLMLSTRIPVERLVDFIDQATLRVHLPLDSRSLEEHADGAVTHDDLANLRRFGIRTATNFESAVADSMERGGDEERRALLAALDACPGDVLRLEVVLDAFRKGAWMENVRYWHSKRGVADRCFEGSPGGDVVERDGTPAPADPASDVA